MSSIFNGSTSKELRIFGLMWTCQASRRMTKHSNAWLPSKVPLQLTSHQLPQDPLDTLRNWADSTPAEMEGILVAKAGLCAS